MKAKMLISHPAAEMFPIIQSGTKEWKDLVDHIRENGQIEPVVVDGDTLLDGRNRLRACEVIGITPRIVEWSSLGLSIDPVKWIIGKNLERRHLTPDQRAMILTEIRLWEAREYATEQKSRTSSRAKRDQKGQIKPVQQKPVAPVSTNRNATRDTIAKEAGVSTYRSDLAIKVHDAVERGELPKEEIAAVKAGTRKLSEAVQRSRKFIEPGEPDEAKASADSAAADKESDGLFQLKRWWRKSTKKDHKEFLRWVEASGGKKERKHK